MNKEMRKEIAKRLGYMLTLVENGMKNIEGDPDDMMDILTTLHVGISDIQDVMEK